MAPLTLRHELNDGGCFISERKLVSPISVRAGAVTAVRRRPDERAQIERILMRTLKRKRFTVALDELTATESVITICYCVIAITRWLLTNRISLHLNTVHAAHYRRESSPA